MLHVCRIRSAKRLESTGGRWAEAVPPESTPVNRNRPEMGPRLVTSAAQVRYAALCPTTQLELASSVCAAGFAQEPDQAFDHPQMSIIVRHPRDHDWSDLTSVPVLTMEAFIHRKEILVP